MLSQSEIFKTVLSGVTVFVLGQILVKLVIEPVQQLKKTIGEICYALHYYSNKYSNPNNLDTDTSKETQEAIRHISCQLAKDFSTVPFYSLTRIVFFLPSREHIFDARTKLIGISNWLLVKGAKAPFWNIKNAQEIADHLGLDSMQQEKIPSETLNRLVDQPCHESDRR